MVGLGREFRKREATVRQDVPAGGVTLGKGRRRLAKVVDRGKGDDPASGVVMAPVEGPRDQGTCGG